MRTPNERRRNARKSHGAAALRPAKRAATDGDARAAKVIIDLVGGMDADKTEDNDKNGVIEIPAVNLSEFEQLKEQEMRRLEEAEHNE